MTRWRRFVRDDEARMDVSEAMTHVAMGSPPKQDQPLSQFSNGLLDIGQTAASDSHYRTETRFLSHTPTS
jgi:hypothetical protein